MIVVPDDGFGGPAIPQLTPPSPGPSPADVFGAEARDANMIVSGLARLRSQFFPPVEGYSAWDEIKDKPEYLEHASKFAGSLSPGETQQMKDQIDRENKDRQIRAASGWMGTVIGLGAGALDPTMLLPGRISIGVGKAGIPMITRAAESAAAFGAATAAQESVLQATQATRESPVASIASSTILGAILGPAIGHLRPGEMDVMARGLDRERAEMDAHVTGSPVTPEPAAPVTAVLPAETPPAVPEAAPMAAEAIPAPGKNIEKLRSAYDAVTQEHGTPQVPISEVAARSGLTPEQVSIELLAASKRGEANLSPSTRGDIENPIVHRGGEPMADVEFKTPAAPPMAAAAGAAATDTRVLKPVGAYGLEKVTFGDPTLIILNQPSVAARRGYADVSELSILTQDNLATEAKVINGVEIPARTGQTSSLGGPPLESLYRTQNNSSQVRLRDRLLDLWKDMRFGGEPAPRLARTTDMFRNFVGIKPTGMTFEQFKEAVSDAMMQEDKHSIPQVQAAAEYVRPHFDQWAGRAEASVPGFEKIESKLGESYFPHRFLTEKIGSKKTQFVDELTELYAGDQTAKHAAQGRIQAYQNSLGSHEQHIGKLTGQLERKQARLEEDEVRAEELQRLNKFAYQRSAQLSEPLDTMRANIRTIEQRIQPEMERLEQLGEDIKAEKESFPEIKEADALIFKMIGAAQKLKQAKDPIATIDAVSEYTEHLDSLISGFKGGIREASEAAKLARRDLGADALVKLENARAEAKKEIAPWLKQLGKIRKELKEEQAARGPLARGGAVFETKIRERGNVIADRLSGQRAEIEDIENRLQAAHASAAEMRGKIEGELLKWEGKSAAEAKSALKARAKYEAEREAKRAEGEPKRGRLTQADEAVDRAVKRILASDRERPIEDLRSRARETTDRILGSPDGRLPYEEAAPQFERGPPSEDLRGSLSHRRLDVSNAFASKWIERDIEKVIQTHNHTFMPDVLLAERFGDIQMENVFREVNEEYNKLIQRASGGAFDAASGEKASRKLENQRKLTNEVLAKTRDRLRGIDGFSSNASQRRMGRLSASVRNVMVPLNMGVSAISSIPDAAGTVFQWGMMSSFRDGWMPFVTSLMTNRQYSREALREAKVMGIAVDTAMAQRHHEVAGIASPYQPGSPVERVLQTAADKMQLVNLLGPWTDIVKTISMTVGATNLYRAAKAATAGKATAKQLTQLNASNIPNTLWEKIVNDYETHGTRVNGVLLPNTEAWSRETRETFESALSRNANINVVTPGLDKNIYMTDPTIAILTQFKSFTAAATTRIMIANLQRSDAQTLQGLVASLALGMVAYKLNAITGGAPTSDRPQDWIKEAMSRANIFGWLEEGNTLAAKASGGKADVYRMIAADKPLSRQVSQSAVDGLLGPTVGKLHDLTRVTGSMATGNWNAGDVKAVRRMIAGQNLFYLRGLFNQVEHGADNAFGIKIPEPKQ